MKNTLCIIIILMLSILVGCTSDFKIDENVVKDFSNKITETVVNKLDKEKAEKKENHSIDASNINELKIENSVGDITITVVDIEKANIDVNIAAYATNKDDAEKLIAEYTYTIESKWNTINIDTTKFAEIKDNEFTVDLNINIPKSIEDISIINNVGDINIDNMEGKIIIKSNVGDISINNSKSSYDINNDVGKININNCTFIGKSDFKINTGDTKITASNISEAKNITAEVNVGNISVLLPENSSYNADINEFLENQRNVVNGYGKTNIKLVTKVGEIKIE